MRKCFLTVSVAFLVISCGTTALQRSGRHYQTYQDYASLWRVVEGIPLGSDTSYIRELLGTPIDMGFDYRYLLDSVGPNGCTLGAVFHLDDQGKVDQKWLNEICE